MGVFIFLAVVTLGCAVLVRGGISHLKISISPAHVNAKHSDDVIVLCKTSAPITGCQFQSSLGGETVDLSQGHDSSDSDGIYAYHGAGLFAGECGIKINATRLYNDESGYFITCRVRSDDTDWTYAATSVFISESQRIPMTTESRILVARPGDELNILYKAQIPLSRCVVEFHGWKNKDEAINDFNEPDECKQPNVCSYGKGLKEKECGVSIKNVTEEFNGKIWFNVDGSPGKFEDLDFVVVIVAKPPSPPVLTIDESIDEDGMTHLDAVCTVRGGRPAANITWYLDGAPVESTVLQYVPDAAWGKRALWHDQTTTQRMTKRLDKTDDGKELWCVAEHFAQNGTLASRKEKLTIIQCPPLTSRTVLIACYLGSERTNCTEPQQVNTLARLHCKPGYTKPNNVIHTSATCLKTGKWSQNVSDCVIDCGRRKSNSGTVPVSNGEDANLGEFPWHVGIYRTQKGGLPPLQICGGSLISTRVVISAAHCFYDYVLGRMANASSFKVAAGKYSRAWEVQESGVQRRDVVDIRDKQFGGRDRNYASDIALVYLRQAVVIDLKVNLVCVDWENVFELWQLRAGSIGVVPGWGYTQDGARSKELKHVDLPYVSADECYDSLQQEVRPLLTSDKFCAGYRNQSKSVCRGDSGGGLTFLDRRSNKYFLRGVVSVTFNQVGFNGTCYADQYVGFTLVSRYISWIQSNV